MARVFDLQPGDVVSLGEETATFIASEQHPKYTDLRLVIWKLHRDNSWSLDALRADQEVGSVLPNAPEQRWNRVQEAFRD
jgi:hypothetical protein